MQGANTPDPLVGDNCSPHYFKVQYAGVGILGLLLCPLLRVDEGEVADSATSTGAGGEETV